MGSINSEKHYTVERFLDYIRAFNAHDYDRQHAFYAPDVVLHLPAAEKLPPLVGSKGIKSHYLPLFEKFVEIITPMELVIGDDNERLFFIMETCFEAKEDIVGQSPGAVFGVKKGGIVRLSVWAFYVLGSDGLMKDIRVIQSNAEDLGNEKPIEYWLADSRSRARKDLWL